MCSGIILFSLVLLSVSVGRAQEEEGYDVIVIAGQSNAVGRGLGEVSENPIYLQEAGRVFQLGRFGADDGKIIPASEPLHHWGQAPGKNIDRKGFAYPFALRYAHGLSKLRKVLLVPVARGSTTILLWDREQQAFTHAGLDDLGPTILWDDMVQRTRQALALHPGNRLVAVLWHQGEADINALANPRSGLHAFMTGGDLYRAKLEELRAGLRKAFDVPGQNPFMFLIGECSETWMPMKGNEAGRKAKADIGEAIKAAAASDPTGASSLVSSAGITGTNPGEDGLHFSAEGAFQLGERFYEALTNLQAELAPTGAPPAASAEAALRNLVRPAKGRGSERLTAQTIRQEVEIYRQTPEGKLAAYIFYPPDWRAGDQRPAMAFFFGGGWKNGSPGQFFPQAEYFASRGLVCVLFDYRVLSRHGTGPDASVADAKAAIRWIRAQAGRLGVDPMRVIGSGGSAGAHLAVATALVSLDPAAGEMKKIPCRPDALVLFNPVMDLREAKILDVVGRSIAEELSPILGLRAEAPPTLMLYGATDPLLKQGKEFFRLAHKLGNDCRLLIAPDSSHGFFNSEPWLTSSALAVDQFLQALGYLNGTSTLSAKSEGGLVEFLPSESENRKPVGKLP